MTGWRLACLGMLLLLQVGLATACRAGPLVVLDTSAVTDPDVVKALQEGHNLSLLMQMEGLPSMVAAPGIEERMQEECVRLTALLRSFGYLEARADCQIEPGHAEAGGASSDDGQAATTTDGVIRIKLLPGQIYRIGIVEIAGVAGNLGDRDIEADLGAMLVRYVGSAARADRLADLESRIAKRIRQRLYPLAATLARDIVTDTKRRLAIVRFQIDVGPRAIIGVVKYRGLHRFPLHSAKFMTPFQPGDPYDAQQIEEYQRRLWGTGMFQSVRVGTADALDETGRMPIIVSLREWPPDPQELASSGMTGLAVSGGTLALIILRQLAMEAGMLRVFRRSFDAVVVMLLVATAVVTVMRFLSLL